MPFSRTLYIDQEDFREDPPKQFFRLSPGREVRLRYAYIITCVGVVKDPATGEVTELRCTYDPETKSGGAQAQRKLERLPTCKVEPSLAAIAPGTRVQFERVGYFCADPDSSPDKLVFNRTVTLKDTWAKIEKAQTPR